MANNDTLAAMKPSEIRRSLSGLEFFQQMLAGKLPAPPMVTLLGMRLVEVAEGRVVFVALPDEPFYNGMGVTHGGFAATMLDTALGCAVNTMLPAGRVMVTLELKVNFTRALSRQAGEVRCEATVVHIGNRTGTSEGRIVDSNGKIYAHGSTTCIAVEARN